MLTTAVLIVAPLVKLVLEPAAHSWTSLQSRIQASQLRLRRGRRFIEHKDKITKAYERWTLPALQKGSDQEEMGRFLEEIGRVARKSPLRFTDLRPQPVRDRGGHKVLVVEAEARAPLRRIARFLYGVRVVNPELHVERLSLVSTKKDLMAKILISKVLVAASGSGEAKSRRK